VPTYPEPLEDEEKSFSKNLSGVLAAQEARMKIRIALLFTGVLVAAGSGAAQTAPKPLDPDQAPIVALDRFSDNCSEGVMLDLSASPGLGSS
jgi:hypothetical protein